MMPVDEIARKSLENPDFIKLRQATEKIAETLDSRLKRHLEILRPLLVPRKLLGTYVKSAAMQEVHGSDKSFAELQERYQALHADPFGLPKKLPAPLPPISAHLDAAAYQYSLYLEGQSGKPTAVTAPTRYILSYQNECSLNRLRRMLSGAEARQPDDIRHCLVCHLTLVIMLDRFPALRQLLEDLRYELEIVNIEDLGGLPVVMLTVPLQTFLPPDDFILQVTQLSGIPAFQEIIDHDAVKNMPDSLQATLLEFVE